MGVAVRFKDRYETCSHYLTSVEREVGSLVFNYLDRGVAAVMHRTQAQVFVPTGSRFARISRRALLGGVAACGKMATSYAQPMSFVDEWRLFKSRFLSPDGRIIDNGNGGISHSEGQGWGLLFAAAARDQACFDLILDWTSRILRRPTDHLHAWRYVPNARPPVQDLNNASDGDLFIAAALARAGRSWRRSDYLEAAAAIGRDILRLLPRKAGSYTILLPGIEGFENRAATIVNPSYYAFPMMAELTTVVPSPEWGRLEKDGRLLLQRGRFGQWLLPPDWLRIGTTDSALSPAPDRPPRFSYDAVRVPLWLSWQQLLAEPVMQSIERFWAEFPFGTTPAWVDLKTGERAPYPATAGMAAIMRLTRNAMGVSVETMPPTVATAANYYDAALIMLTHLAEQKVASN
jgi:endoglucanase